MVASRRFVLPVLMSVLLTGCGDIFGTKDASQPGEVLGRFHVEATRTANTCGEGALGTTPAWEFDVTLSRGAGQLFWDNGAQVITGVVDADEKAFHIDGDFTIDMRKDTMGKGLPACSVSRHDEAKGTLGGTSADVPSFAGTLAFDFAPTAGSECSDLTGGTAPVVAALPCGFAYSIAGTRTDATP